MSSRRIKASMVLGGDSALVERPAPGAAPTAFRIWRAGANVTDHGTHLFTPRSAELLMVEQAARGNLYSVDFDHKSLNPNAPPEAGRAAGWHRLEVRESVDGPELWACAVEWTADVRRGLEADPPEWRYFSPAYDVDPESGEITRYVNTAITNTPATWSNTTLATRAIKGGQLVKKAELLAALAAMAEGEGEMAEKAKALYAALEGEPEEKAAEGDEHLEPDGDEGKGGKGDENGDEKKAEEEPAKESAKVQASRVALALRVAQLEAQVERHAVRAMVEANADRFTASTRAWALGESADVVQRYLAKAPKVATRAPAEKQATRGAEQGSTAVTPVIGNDDASKIDRILGILPSGGDVGYGAPDANTGVRRFSSMTPAQIRAAREQKGAR